MVKGGVFGMQNNMLHLYIGDGKGKTCSAYGLALRALGCGFKVAIFSFLKSPKSGEIKILKELSKTNPLLSLNISDKDHGFYYTLSDIEKQEVQSEVNDLANKFEKSLKDNLFDLIILDEIIDAINLNLVCEENFISLLKKRNTEIVLTGRNPSENLIDIADYVSDVNKIKHPYDKGIPARRGIEY